MYFWFFFRTLSEDGFLVDILVILASIWGRFWDPEALQTESRMGPETRTLPTAKLGAPYGELGWLGGSAARALRKKEIPTGACSWPGSYPEAIG